MARQKPLFQLRRLSCSVLISMFFLISDKGHLVQVFVGCCTLLVGEELFVRSVFLEIDHASSITDSEGITKERRPWLWGGVLPEGVWSGQLDDVIGCPEAASMLTTLRRAG